MYSNNRFRKLKLKILNKKIPFWDKIQPFILVRLPLDATGTSKNEAFQRYL